MRKSYKLLLQLSLAGSMFAIICNGPAAALTITIDDTTDNVVITSDSKNTQVTKIATNFGEIFQITDPLLNSAGTGAEADLVEPPGSLTGFQMISDQIKVDPATFSLDFFSDSEPGGVLLENCSFPSFDCIAETNNSVDVGPILYGASSGISIIVTSDLDPVPEPSGLSVLGSALAGMGALMWRRRGRFDHRGYPRLGSR
jgi:hypothetical protein